jgi:hypothetical protein
MRKSLLLIVLALFGLSLTLAYAQAPDGQEYVVQKDDWLSKIAEKEYGDPLTYPAIVQATNAKAAEDESFSVIEDPDVIEVGQKLWLPAQAETQAPAFQAEDVIGIYKTFLPGASSPGLDETLYLNFDNTVRWVSDYLEGNPPIIEVGTWEIVDGLVTVTITGQEDRAYDSPQTTTFTPSQGGLALTRSQEIPGALDIRYLPFESLALDPESIPYDPDQATNMIQDAGFLGYYKAFLPAASSPGRDITLLLGINDLATLNTDFLNGEPPVLETGSWAVTDGIVSVSLGDTPLTLELVDGTLRTTPDVDAYGAEGLTLYFFRVLVTTLYPVVGSGSEGLAPDQLKNATYSGIYDEPVTLTNGVYEGEPFVEGAAARPTVSFVDDLVVHGDLNGDGVEDVAVLLVESSGGSGIFTYLAAVLDQNGQPVNVGTALVGDRTQIKSIVIENGQIRMDVITQGPDDPMCCPTQKVRNVYEVHDDGLVEVSSEAQGTVSLDDLMGSAWILDEVAQDLIIDMLPTLPGTQVTASFADGQASGSTGCNDYTAPVSSDGGQALTIGPIASTQKACAELVMDQEAEYLAALGKTVQWSYWAGKLALTYQTDDGSIGTLIFVPASAE